MKAFTVNLPLRMQLFTAMRVNLAIHYTFQRQLFQIENQSSFVYNYRYLLCDYGSILKKNYAKLIGMLVGDATIFLPRCISALN